MASLKWRERVRYGGGIPSLPPPSIGLGFGQHPAATPLAEIEPNRRGITRAEVGRRSRIGATHARAPLCRKRTPGRRCVGSCVSNSRASWGRTSMRPHSDCACVIAGSPATPIELAKPRSYGAYSFFLWRISIASNFAPIAPADTPSRSSTKGFRVSKSWRSSLLPSF
jgi:hypothetical protein